MTNLDVRYKLCSPITNASTKVHGIVLVFRIRILLGSGFKWVSGSGPREAKIASKKEKMKKFSVFEAFSVGLEAFPET